MKPVMVVAGTRPEIIKLAPVLKGLYELKLNPIFVWSGQHYDYELSDVFFEQLNVPRPDTNLNIGSGSHAKQTARAIVNIEKAINKYNPSIVLAEGDTNTVAATALVASKNNVPFAHVEAGLRSFDKTMPEEVNRVVADSLSEVLFAPTKLAVMNLCHEGIPLRKIHLTGNTIVDVITEHKTIVNKKSRELLDKLGIKSHEYLLATLHRQENTNNISRLTSIVKALIALSKSYKIVFTLHPRTKKKLRTSGLSLCFKDNNNLIPLPALGYIEFLGLLMNSLTVVTDSGGVQEEALTLGIPTVTVRYNTERPETTLYGVNVLAGTKAKSIYNLTLSQMQKRREIENTMKVRSNPFGDGRAGKRIAKCIRDAVDGGIEVQSSDTRWDPYILYAFINSEFLKEVDDTFEVLATYSKAGYQITPSKRKEISGRMTLIRAPISKIEKLLFERTRKGRPSEA